MALRAGYYGVKRFLRDKLAMIAKTYDDTIKSLFPRSEQAVLGAVNLLDYKLNYDDAGLTVVLNPDNSITVTGTASADLSLTGSMKFNLPKGKYYLSGCVGGSSSTYFIDVYENQWTNRNICYNGVIPFTFTTDINHVFRIFIKSGYTINTTFKPMIALSPNTPYAPYTMTNKDLTDSASDQKTAINAIITAAAGAADFAAFKTAMGAITPVTRSLSLTKEDIAEEVKEDVEPEKTVTKKRTTKKTEEV